jgi:hypothetical protein
VGLEDGGAAGTTGGAGWERPSCQFDLGQMGTQGPDRLALPVRGAL